MQGTGAFYEYESTYRVASCIDENENIYRIKVDSERYNVDIDSWTLVKNDNTFIQLWVNFSDSHDGDIVTLINSNTRYNLSSDRITVEGGSFICWKLLAEYQDGRYDVSAYRYYENTFGVYISGHSWYEAELPDIRSYSTTLLETNILSFYPQFRIGIFTVLDTFLLIGIAVMIVLLYLQLTNRIDLHFTTIEI